MMIRWSEIPDHAVPMFPAEKRRCDSMNLIIELRLQSRPGAKLGTREYRLVGGSTGWFEPKPEVGYPGVPGYVDEFFLAGLVAAPNEYREDDWRTVTLTRAGEFLWMTWVRDSHRRREQP